MRNYIEGDLLPDCHPKTPSQAFKEPWVLGTFQSQRSSREIRDWPVVDVEYYQTLVHQRPSP